MLVAVLFRPAEATPQQIEEVCGPNPNGVCRWILNQTGNETLAEIGKFLVGRPLEILITVFVAWILSFVARRLIRRAGAHAARRDPDSHLALPLTTARLKTLTGVAASVVAVIIWSFAIISILATLGVSLIPLLASAGVATAALGFGAQNIVKDFLSGFFMLAEGQFEVGDTIDVGEASGTVEGITLRRTQLRGVDGTVWHVPNGEIRRVGNRSQQWSQAVLDLRIASDSDLVRAQAVIEAAARRVVEQEPWNSMVLAEPEVWGVEQLGPDGAVIRLVVKTAPGQQGPLLRRVTGGDEGRLRSRRHRAASAAAAGPRPLTGRRRIAELIPFEAGSGTVHDGAAAAPRPRRRSVWPSSPVTRSTRK